MGIGELFEFEKTGRIDDGKRKIKRCPVHGCEFITIFKSVCTDLGGLLHCPECNREFKELIEDKNIKPTHKRFNSKEDLLSEDL